MRTSQACSQKYLIFMKFKYKCGIKSLTNLVYVSFQILHFLWYSEADATLIKLSGASKKGPAWEKTWVSRRGGDKRVRWKWVGPNTWHTCLKMSQWKPCCIISTCQKKPIGKLLLSMSIFVSRNFYFVITKFGVRTTRLPRVCIINQSPQMWL